MTTPPIRKLPLQQLLLLRAEFSLTGAAVKNFEGHIVAKILIYNKTCYAFRIRDTLEEMPLSEDAHLANEVCKNMRRIQRGVAESMMRWVAMDSGLPYGPLSKLPEVPRLPPPAVGRKKKRKSQRQEDAGDLPRDCLDICCFPCWVSGEALPDSKSGSVRSRHHHCHIA